MELVDFLRGDRYAQLCAVLHRLQNDDQAWSKNGPANKRNFYSLKDIHNLSSSAYQQLLPQLAYVATSNDNDNSSTNAISDCTFISALHSFFQSQAFVDYLTQLTQITPLHLSHSKQRSFRQGCYTLAHDDDAEERYRSALDVNYCCMIVPQSSNNSSAKKGSKKKRAIYDEQMGGTLHYIVEGEVDELLHLAPRTNCLSLVYRAGMSADQRSGTPSGKGGILKFIKFCNSTLIAPRVDFDYVLRVEENEEEEEDGEDEDDEDDEDEEDGESNADEEDSPTEPAQKVAKTSKQ